MRVRELIALLQAEDPEALVVTWPDVHEGGGYLNATDIQRLKVKPRDDDGEMGEYLHEGDKSKYAPSAEGMVPAVEIV